MIRVGFIFNVNENWLGGVNYFRNLLSAVMANPARQIEPIVFTSLQVDEKLLKSLPSVEIIKTNLLERLPLLKRLLRKTYKFAFRTDRLLEELLIKHKIDVLSHHQSLGKLSVIPSIGWIPDFQHIHLPHFFTAEEYANRNKDFMNICQYCNKVLLSSYAAQSDLVEFASNFASKARVLQFVVEPPNDSNEISLMELEDIYSFTGAYFYMPNQFWAHKNHRIVIEALKILKGSGREVLVLATGNTHDYRQPNYFAELMEYAHSCGIMDVFRVLGIVPYNHVVALMKNCVSIINPSLFEGWSTTVEESKSLGKRIILSNIPVHQEQNPSGCVFFDPHNPHSLAEAIWNVYMNSKSSIDAELAYKAKTTIAARQLHFADTYEKIIQEVYRESRMDA